MNTIATANGTFTVMIMPIAAGASMRNGKPMKPAFAYAALRPNYVEPGEITRQR